MSRSPALRMTGRQQAALGVDRDAHVLGGRVDDAVAVDRRVDDRVRRERLGRRQREERQEGELVAGLREELALDPVAESRDARDIDLDHGGELGGGRHRDDGALGDDLAQARHRHGGAAQRRGLERRAGRRSGCRRGSGGRGVRRDDVLLADAAADTGAGDAREVDALLVRELAHDRGDVAAGAGVRARRGARPVRPRARAPVRPGRQARRGRRRRCGRSRGGRGRGGRARGGRSRRGAAGAGGRGAGRRRRGAGAAAGAALRGPVRRGAGAASGAGAARSGLGCRRGRGSARSGLGRGAASGAGAAAAAGAVADGHERRADLDGLVLLDEDRLDHPGDGRRDLGVDLVGRHLEQRLVDLHTVADVLQPAGDRALRDTLTECREADGFAHALVSFTACDAF